MASSSRFWRLPPDSAGTVARNNLYCKNNEPTFIEPAELIMPDVATVPGTDGQKMSKSLGNFITIRDILKKYPFYLIRLWVASAHYRSPLDFSEDALKQIETKLMRIDEIIARLQTLEKYKTDNIEINIKEITEGFENSVKKELDDDFNTPKALAVVFSFIKNS